MNLDREMKYSEMLINYLEGEISEKDKILVESWINEKEENRIFFEELRKLYDKGELSEEVEKINEKEEFEKLDKKINQELRQGKVITLKFFVKIAAVIILVLGLLYLLMPVKQNPVIVQTSTTILSDTLSDGSVISLNENSKLEYPGKFLKHSREVYLTGEAFFNIKNLNNQPFVVNTDYAKIVVLGTVFNVNAYPDSNVIVTVQAGKVAVIKKDKKIKNINSENIVNPGQKAVYSAQTKKLKVYENDTLNYQSWRTGILHFKDTRLSEVAKILEKQFKVTIIIDNKKLKKCRLTADFDNKSIESVLEVIKATLGIDYKIEENQITILGDGC